jgi:ribonuclease-3
MAASMPRSFIDVVAADRRRRRRKVKRRSQDCPRCRNGCSHGLGLPHYRLVSAEGPDHRKRFEIEVLVGGEVAGSAAGRAKKEAEQQAAREALGKLKGTRQSH